MKNSPDYHWVKRIITSGILLLTFFVVFGQKEYNQLTNLPTLYIFTEDGVSITSKTEYVPGSIVIKSSDPSEELSMSLEIRGRGNSTWNMPKKPYRIKLESKTTLLNLPAKAKKWVLLANYADKTLIRNALAFKISEEVDMEFTPAFRLVDVVLNGDYIGNYTLTDQVEVKKARVPVEEQDEYTEDISGGYLVEVNGLAKLDPVWFVTDKNITISTKYPKHDEITDEQKKYISDFVKRFETLLFSNDFTDPDKGYRSLVDEESLINWYIACELTGNSDSFWSTYLYKYRGLDKLFFGPLWDFDIAFNNDIRLGDATEKFMKEAAHYHKIWIARLWEDPWFKQAVKEKWQQLVDKENIEGKLLSFIEELSILIDTSQKKNFERWDVLDSRVYYELYLYSTYKEGIEALSEYIKKRISFLTKGFEATLSFIPTNENVGLKIYPNPVSELLIVEIPYQMRDSGEIYIEIIDMNGKHLYRSIDDNINRETIDVDISSLSISSGIYLLKIRDTEKEYIKKLIIQKF